MSPTFASSARVLRLVGVPVDDAVAGVLVAEKDVLGDREHRHQRQFLVDDDDADPLAVMDALELAFLRRER